MAEQCASTSTGGEVLGVAVAGAPAGRVLVGSKLEPVPVPGCDVCESCDKEREVARLAGRSLEVRSLNGVIAGHPHGREVRA